MLGICHNRPKRNNTEASGRSVEYWFSVPHLHSLHVLRRDFCLFFVFRISAGPKYLDGLNFHLFFRDAS